jgi:MoxR-like ATPase
MAWVSYYTGEGDPRDITFEDPPRWREFPRKQLGTEFQPPEGLLDAVNAALNLRRPLLVTGSPGSGKSTLIESVARELKFGDVLQWHITSRSELSDALYRYDVLGRIHEQQLAKDTRVPGVVKPSGIAPFLRLGPLGTAFVPADRPRALLIDELDKSDLDLPSDLLEILERGEFEIPELTRYHETEVPIRLWSSGHEEPDAEPEEYTVPKGRVQCTQFPFIVMTSNGDRDFPPAFLRRCVRFTMPRPSEDDLRRMVAAHLLLDVPEDGPLADVVSAFAERLEAKESLAVDQLLNAIFVLTGEGAPDDQATRDRLLTLLTRELGRA